MWFVHFQQGLKEHSFEESFEVFQNLDVQRQGIKRQEKQIVFAFIIMHTKRKSFFFLYYINSMYYTPLCCVHVVILHCEFLLVLSCTCVNVHCCQFQGYFIVNPSFFFFKLSLSGCEWLMTLRWIVGRGFSGSARPQGDPGPPIAGSVMVCPWQPRCTTHPTLSRPLLKIPGDVLVFYGSACPLLYVFQQ